MSYEDSNRELRIRQRSIMNNQYCILAMAGWLAMAGALSWAMNEPVLLGACGAFMYVWSMYRARRDRAGTWVRSLYKRVSDTPVPAHEIDVLKERGKSQDAVTDGGK